MKIEVETAINHRGEEVKQYTLDFKDQMKGHRTLRPAEASWRGGHRSFAQVVFDAKVDGEWTRLPRASSMDMQKLIFLDDLDEAGVKHGSLTKRYIRKVWPLVAAAQGRHDGVLERVPKLDEYLRVVDIFHPRKK